MAAPNITADNLRVDDAQSNAGWTNDGGGGPTPAAEPSYRYNDTLAINKLSNSTSYEGLKYTPTSDGKGTNNHTAADRDVWLCKCLVSDNGDLNTTDGVLAACGSAVGNRREWVIAGSDAVAAHLATYSSVGGVGGAYLIVPIKVDQTNYRVAAGDTGTPNFAAADHYSLKSRFQNGNAKSENLASAAIDFGSGLYVVGGTAPDAPAEPSDLVDFDQGTAANRFGYAYLSGGTTPAVNGRTRLGTDDDSTHSAVRFTIPAGQTVYIPQHLADAGWSAWEFWLGDAGTEIVINGRLESLGNATTIDDRGDIVTVAGAGGGTVTGASTGYLANKRNVSLNSQWTFAGTIECVDLTQNGADLDGATLGLESASGVAACDDADFTKLQGAKIVQRGAGHAFAVPGTTTITLTEMDFDAAFGANGTNDAALYFTGTSGTIDVILDGMTMPTYRTAGVTVNPIVGQVTTTLEANVSLLDAEVRIYDYNGTLPSLGDELAGVENALAATFDFTTSTGNQVWIQVLKDGFEEYGELFTVPAASSTKTITLTVETNR